MVLYKEQNKITNHNIIANFVLFLLNRSVLELLSNNIKRRLMITQEILTWPIIPRENLYPKSIEAFLDAFEGILDLDIETGMELDFLIEGREASTKISPVLKLARPEDAKDLADICKKEI